MKKMILDLLNEHHENCGDNLGRDGEYLSDSVTNIIDLVKQFPSDDEIARLRKDSVDLSWTLNPDRMGQ
jgi:hypothetical protein